MSLRETVNLRALVWGSDRAAALHEYETSRCGDFAEPVASGGQVLVEAARPRRGRSMGC
jgi:hypothetical protein